MKDEIAAAVVFLTRIVKQNTKLTAEQLSRFSEQLAHTLVEKFRNHWYEDKPSKGQAYRCIRVSRNEPRDSVIDRTARVCGIHYNHLNLPAELMLWVDPMEVSCRFGERGTVCQVAKFKHHQTTDNRCSSPQTTDNLNDNTVVSKVLQDELNDNSPTINMSIASPPGSPALNDNWRPSARKTLVHAGIGKNTSRFVFNKNAANMPRSLVQNQTHRPQNKVWSRLAYAGPEQYRWVNKSVTARA